MTGIEFAGQLMASCEKQTLQVGLSGNSTHLKLGPAGAGNATHTD